MIYHQILFLIFLLFINCSFSFDPIRVMCEINGHIVPAMIDTGAEISVMSSSCAKLCQVANLIDPQHAGRAVGVGSSDILGAIDHLNLRIGPLNFQNRISILQNSRCDLLIGLDILQRFKCEINLRDRVLRFNVRGDNIRIPLINSDSKRVNNVEFLTSSISVSDEPFHQINHMNEYDNSEKLLNEKQIVNEDDFYLDDDDIRDDFDEYQHVSMEGV